MPDMRAWTSPGAASEQLRALVCGMLARLGDACAAGLRPAGRPAVAADRTTVYLLSTAAGASAYTMRAACEAGGGGDAGSWRRVVLQLRPFELLDACLSSLSSGHLDASFVLPLMVAAGGLSTHLPAEGRAAVRSAAGTHSRLQPLVLRALVGMARTMGPDFNFAVALNSLTVQLWELWQQPAWTEAAAERADRLTRELLRVAEADGYAARLPAPEAAPAAALAALPGCSNPLCSNLEGGSEADLQLLSCSRCKAAAYCSRCAATGTGEGGCCAARCGLHAGLRARRRKCGCSAALPRRPCQAAHWRAGHKSVCAANGAGPSAAGGAGGVGPSVEGGASGGGGGNGAHG
jgi:hypothetical protein